MVSNLHIQFIDLISIYILKYIVGYSKSCVELTSHPSLIELELIGSIVVRSTTWPVARLA